MVMKITPEHREKINAALRRPDVKPRLSAAHRGHVHPPDACERIRLGKLGDKNPAKRPEVRQKIKERLNDPEVKERRSLAIKEAMAKPEVRAKFTGDNNPMRRNADVRDKSRERSIIGSNDIWYGGVKYPYDKPGAYCEKWTPEFRERIRSFWGYKSPLSKEVVSTRGGHKLDCHHVYYQKKACCYWDEDNQGYFIIIDKKKHYIRGDPNKFVPLTRKEHTATLKNKISWM